MTTYLANAFSLNMLATTAKVDCERLDSIEIVKHHLETGFVSAVGHEATAHGLEKLLHLTIPTNRIEVKLQLGDTLIVAQIQGGRLPEGRVIEGDIKSFTFWLIRLVPNIPSRCPKCMQELFGECAYDSGTNHNYFDLQCFNGHSFLYSENRNTGEIRLICKFE